MPQQITDGPAPSGAWHAIDFDRLDMMLFCPPAVPEGSRRVVAEEFDDRLVEGIDFGSVPPDVDVLAGAKGTERPDPVLCQAEDCSPRFRVFLHQRDVPGSGFAPTGKGWAIMGPVELERFREHLRELNAIAADTDSFDTPENLQAIDRALAANRSGGNG